MFNYYPKDKVFSFEKSAKEEVQFAVSDRKGKPYVDMRVYHIQEDGSKIGTHKGIFVPAEKLADFKEGIERLIEATRPKAA
jgi:hypothetical protein